MKFEIYSEMLTENRINKIEDSKPDIHNVKQK